MEFIPLNIAGSYEIILKPFRDNRGSFTTVYDVAPFAARGLVTDWVADNQSFNVASNILRGFHFQVPPYAQTKLVRAIVGKALDIFVDLRKGSPSYLKAVGVELSEEKTNAVYIPKGCAHAYLTLTDGCIIGYKVDAIYAPLYEGGIRWNDPDLHFNWPSGSEPLISDKDARWPLLKDWPNPF
jgi:dTDP-4-dehydrorhamnose 3,5-epimerase